MAGATACGSERLGTNPPQRPNRRGGSIPVGEVGQIKVGLDTLPSELRAIARTHPQAIYSMLFHASAAALQQLACDPRFLGGQIGMLGVLQTWTRDLRYHPHIHFLVPALALSPDSKRWLVGKEDFLVHVKPLGQLFRAKFRASLAKTSWAHEVSGRVWTQSWVVDCRPVGSGATALKYLAPYIFRIALSNNRIERLANDEVTFRYTDGKTGQKKRSTLLVDAFISRFLAHVLPKGFVKVRYYGLLCPGKRHLLKEVRSLLTLQQAGGERPLHAAAPQPERVATRCSLLSVLRAGDAAGYDASAAATP